MKTENVNGHIIITADDGFFIEKVDGTIFGNQINLGINDVVENYVEKPMSEFPIIETEVVEDEQVENENVVDDSDLALLNMIKEFLKMNK